LTGGAPELGDLDFFFQRIGSNQDSIVDLESGETVVTV
jgi:hypothetical protein